MNILKEKIKLWVAQPDWNRYFKKIENTNNKKIILIGTPAHGNLGDHAIAEQEKEFFKDYFSDYQLFEVLMPMYHTQKSRLKKSVGDDDIVVISGGGWMGNLWIHNEYVIREVIQSYPHNKVVILPQTAYYTNDLDGREESEITAKIVSQHQNLRLFVRDQQSYDYLQNHFVFSGQSRVTLKPDMVLYGKGIGNQPQNSEKGDYINVCLREDCETEQSSLAEYKQLWNESYAIQEVSTVKDHPISLNQRTAELNECWNEFASAKLTITDRLHAMLFSVLNGTPVIALNNRTGKVFGVAKWLESTEMITIVNSLDEVLPAIKNVNLTAGSYDHNMFQNDFKDMAAIIREEQKS